MARKTPRQSARGTRADTGSSPPRRLLRRVGGAWRNPRTRRRILLFGSGFLLVVVALLAWGLSPYWQLSGQFDDVPARQPSRLYGRAPIVAVDELIDLERVMALLEDEGYRAREEGARAAPGLYERRDGELVIYQRLFPTPQGSAGGAPLAIRLRGERVVGLEIAGEAVERAWLDPPLIASYYGEDLKERRPLRVDDMPDHLVQAILAAEDQAFFRHAGLSPTGILRAVWVNFRGEEVSQGGSTITQQLVKNLYLTHERTYSRKLREAILAVFLEVRYSKREILQAYMNEIYLGGTGGVNLMGFGAASRAFFGKDPAQLDLAESALLAGVIRSPANYSPLTNAERAKGRRDWVLERMVETGALEAEAAERAQAEPVRVNPEPVVRRRAPYFAERVEEEAARRYGIHDLDDGGYMLLSTLDWTGQEQAAEAVGWGLDALENGWEKGNQRSEGPLQAALVSIDPRDGGILAYVGGRDYAESQFDRASQAKRQAGSAFKPVVFASAFESGRASPATLLEDSPLTVNLPTQTWRPENYDRQFHGWVRARTVLEQSYNVATARLALQTGLENVVDTARKMGITAPLDPVPALALGAFEVTPLELSSVYATLATGGQRPEIHGLSTVFDREGRRIDGLALAQPEQVISPETSYLVTALLMGVLDHGTAAGARTQGLRGPLAGKTGTTNGRRDNWFAGYSPERSTVVWVGYDDNAQTRMSGSRAAVPIWTRFTIRVAPPGGYTRFKAPSGVTTAVIDPETGELATDDCPQTLVEVFRQGQVPERVCERHTYDRWGERDRYDQDRGRYEDDEEWRERRDRDRGRVRRWLDRVFGGDEEEENEPPPPIR